MALRSSTENQGTSATPTVAVPSGAAIDDIAILILDIDRTENPASLWPAGFTQFDEDTGFGQTLAAAWKRLTGADSGSYTMSAFGGSSSYNMFAQLFSGRHTTDPPVMGTITINAGANSSPATLTPNNVTAIDDDDLDIFGCLNYDSSQATITWTWPGSFTEDREYSISTWVPMGCAVRQAAPAGSGTGLSSIATWSGGTAKWATGLIRIPVGAGGGGSTITPFAGRQVGFTPGR